MTVATGGGLATLSVAKYLQVSKDQLRSLRESFLKVKSKDDSISRHFFTRAMHKANIQSNTTRNYERGRGFNNKHQQLLPKLQQSTNTKDGRHPSNAPNQQYVLHLLFTMWDVQGVDRVYYYDFLMGLVLLACPHDPLASILQFAMELLDVHSTYKISPSQLDLILQSMYGK